MSGAGAEVDDPVGVGHHRLVMLDHDHRLAGFDKTVEQAKQVFDVGEVQARGRFVEDVGAALLRHVHGEFETLAFAAGERRERLAQADVAEADVIEVAQDGVRARGACLAGPEECRGLGHRHREDLADVAPAEAVFEDRGAEPFPLALLAGGGDARHHREVGVDHARTVARRAGPLGVRAEEGGFHAVRLREGGADRVEESGVSGRVAAS